jgi:hypothetical protein
MQEGAFVLMDCLGFKGVWQRVREPREIIDKLRGIESSFHQRISARLPSLLQQPRFAFSTAFLSDTIVIAGFVKDQRLPNDDFKGILVVAASFAAQEVVGSFRRDPYPLALRGCITFGQFIVDGSLILGPAVDEVASLHELPEGAFVFLSPGADRVRAAAMRPIADAMVDLARDSSEALVNQIIATFPPNIREIIERRRGRFADLVLKIATDATVPSEAAMTFHVEDYPMAIKGGQVLKATLLNPYLDVEASEITAVIAQFSKIMAKDSLDVVIKRQRTLEFLDYVRRRTDARYARVAAQLRDWAVREASEKGGTKAY